MNNKGQSVISEHTMVFFVVTAALVAMTLYVQRSFEARIHDARNYMIDSVINKQVCDANCLAATGNNIAHEYEPYYLETLSTVLHNSAETKGLTQGSAAETGSIYFNEVSDQTKVFSTSVQQPPGCADGALVKPSTCVNN